MPKAPENLNEFPSLVKVVEHLRGPNGCPWDKEQDHKSLTRYAIEECYEFIDAVNKENFDEMKDELGDMLLQVILHAQIASETNKFSIKDVIESINLKMIRRHPHVFANDNVSDSAEVLVNWEEIKKLEKANKPKKPGFDIPTGLPPLLRSLKMGEKAKKRKFDWQNIDGVIAKVDEELQEVKEAITEKNQDHIKHEMGDLLFSVCQLARHLNINPEESLQLTNDRFDKRFIKMNLIINELDKKLEDLSESEKEKFWQLAKKELKT